MKLSNGFELAGGSRVLQYRQRGAFSPADLPGLIGYWKMDEPSGSVSIDSSPEGNNGAYTGVTLGQPGVGQGYAVGTCPLFDGVGDFNNIYSAGLAADFDGAEGTLALWAKVSAAGVWTDGVARHLAIFAVDGSNRLRIQRTATDNTLLWEYLAGGTAEQRTSAVLGGVTDFFHIGLTWSKSGDVVRAYASGAQVGADMTGLGTWAGVPAAGGAVLGAFNLTPNFPWSGFLAHAALYNRALTAAEMAQLAVV